MKLTPMDIKNKEFKKAIRGYATDEVDEFMEEIVENYEEIFKENSRLKDTVSRIRALWKTRRYNSKYIIISTKCGWSSKRKLSKRSWFNNEEC